MPYSWGGGQLFGFFCGNQAQKNVGKSFDFLCVFLNLDYLGILEKKKNVFLNLLPFFFNVEGTKTFQIVQNAKKNEEKGQILELSSTQRSRFFWNLPKRGTTQHPRGGVRPPPHRPPASPVGGGA